MILLQKYTVSADGKWLYIKAITNPDIEDAYFTGLILSTDGTETETLATVLQEALDNAGIVWSDKPTAIDIRVDIDGVDKPFYLTITAEGTIPDTQTCSYKKTLTSITYNKYPIYKVLDCAAKELDGCDVPQVFIDYLIRLKALEAAVEIEDAEAINKYYSRLLGKSNNVVQAGRPCGCHS